jgi:hypothetical protein
MRRLWDGEGQRGVMLRWAMGAEAVGLDAVVSSRKS